MINVTLSGDANKYKGSKAGIYYMQPGFSDEQRYWMSPEGNAIWYSTDGDWNIGPSKNLGTTTVSLYVPIKDPSKECPHDSLQSNWRYYTGNEFLEDVSNSVRIHCVKGNRKNQPVINCNYQTF